MTVAELIQKLQAMPQDIPVVIRVHSVLTDLDDDQPRLIRAEDRKMIKRNGNYMYWFDSYKKPEDPDPEFVTACEFWQL